MNYITNWESEQNEDLIFREEERYKIGKMFEINYKIGKAENTNTLPKSKKNIISIFRNHYRNGKLIGQDKIY